MKTTYHRKLVRDNIPDICRANGAEPETRILSQEEYVDELKKKLLEEAKETAENPVLDELADVLEIVKSLADLSGATLEDVERVRQEKAGKRGGFSQRIYLESTVE